MITTPKILVVEDSPTILKFVSFSLKQHGYSIVSASDGMEAVERLFMTTPLINLIITDLNMPNLDGYALIQTVRQNPEHTDTPIIILSSEVSPTDMARGMTVGPTLIW